MRRCDLEGEGVRATSIGSKAPPAPVCSGGFQLRAIDGAPKGAVVLGVGSEEPP